MKRIGIVTALSLLLSLCATVAMADTLQNRFGVTGRFGFLVPADSETVAPTFNLSTDIGFVGGGGLIYGVHKNVAIELDVTHTDFDANFAGADVGNFETTNVGIGAQYRFNDPFPHLTPFLGAGLDILINDFTAVDGTATDVDTVVGMHIKAGVDYFIMKQLALTTELKGVIAPDADISFAGLKVGNYDPTSFSMTFGARFFFN
ncbi:MAG TPA: OmpW family outer membrane protein [Geobacteraceae bacterium]